jgi:uncharacterized glyoxalase superfamily protein PhnB
VIYILKKRRFVVEKITPNIMVKDVNNTIDYYKNVLEFEFVMGVDENEKVIMEESNDLNFTWAMLKKNNIEIMLQREDSFTKELPELKEIKMGGTFSLYISMYNVKDFFEKIKDKVEIIKNMYITFYGADEFIIKDLNGYILYFSEAKNE